MIRPARAWRQTPAILAFALLAFQAAIPWLSLGFVTQDGPSHLYTALVARDLLLHSDSPYAAVYELQAKLLTNWSTTILMNVAEVLFGPRDAEHAVASFSIVLGFFGWSYLRRSLDPQGSPWSPVTNFLLLSWFLWIGFYNFYLGMAILPFVLGYYIRRSRNLDRRSTAIVAAGLVVLFFTHVLALGLALISIGLTALWTRNIRSFLWSAAALFPALLLLLFFILGSAQNGEYDPGLGWAWTSFPMHTFASTRGRTGEQLLLMPGMLLFAVVGALAMRRSEWTSARGPMFVSAVLSYILYLLMPNSGFGGVEIKIRFAWAVFLFGCTAASTVRRLQPIRVPVAIYASVFVAATLIQALRINAQSVSPAVRAYLAAFEQMPPGSTFLRLQFRTDNVRKRYGYEQAALEPLYHLDSLAAARRRLVALSDYQALSRLFPVGLRPAIPDTKLYQMWDLEGSGESSVGSLRLLLKDPPVPIDYVVILGDQPPSDRAEQYQAIVRELDAQMRLVSGNAPGSFVRVYKRAAAK